MDSLSGFTVFVQVAETRSLVAAGCLLEGIGFGYGQERGVVGGIPERPTDLSGHSCLHYRYPNTGKLEVWPLRSTAGELDLQLPTSMICNNIETRVCFALRGLGIACLPDFAIRGALADGSLRTVLDRYVERSGTFRVLWPSGRQASPKIRAFIDFLSERVFPSSASTT